MNRKTIKNLSIEEAFSYLKKGFIISRECFLHGDYYYLDEEDIFRYHSSSDKKDKVGVLSFLNPIRMNDWIAEKRLSKTHTKKEYSKVKLA